MKCKMFWLKRAENNLDYFKQSNLPTIQTSMYDIYIGSMLVNRLIFNYPVIKKFYFLLITIILVIKVKMNGNFTIKMVSQGSAAYAALINFEIDQICMIVGLIIESYYHPSKSFVNQFDEIWKQLDISRDLITKKKLQSSLRIVKIKSSLIILILALDVLFDEIVDYSQTKSKITLIVQILIEFILLLFQFNLLCGLLIAGSFIKIGHERLHQMILINMRQIYLGDQVFHQFRKDHYKLIALSNLCDLNYRRFVTTSCIVMIPKATTLIFITLISDRDISASINPILWALGLLIGLMVFIQCLFIFVNCPANVAEHVYQATLIERSDYFKSEVTLLNELIKKQLAGISFFGLYLINSEAISTLITFNFTVAMAVPNFLNAKNQIKENE